MLEIGCGRGGFAIRLAERYRYLGVEPDPESLGVARARLAAYGSGAELRCGDVSVVEPVERFDLVCAFEVLEHVEEDRAEVAAWAARLRPGGTLLLTTPGYAARFAAADEMVGHVRRYDPSALRALLVDLDLEDVQVDAFGAPLANALEAVRNLIARMRRGRTSDLSREARTAGSGRLLQPNDGLVAFCVWAAALPFRKLQHLLPGRGPVLVAVARARADQDPASTAT